MPSVRFDDYAEEISEELGDAFFSYDPLEPEETQETLPEVVEETPKKLKKDFHKYSVHGKKLKSKDITILLAQNKHPCGYLRDLHMYHSPDGDVLTGLCALTESFSPCRFPRILKNPLRNDCPIYLEKERELERKAKTPLKIYRKTG